MITKVRNTELSTKQTVKKRKLPKKAETKIEMKEMTHTISMTPVYLGKLLKKNEEKIERKQVKQKSGKQVRKSVEGKNMPSKSTNLNEIASFFIEDFSTFQQKLVKMCQENNITVETRSTYEFQLKRKLSNLTMIIEESKGSKKACFYESEESDGKGKDIIKLVLINVGL